MPVYCDYIVERIKRCLALNDPQGLIGSVGKIRADLYDDGAPRSSRHTLEVTDFSGKRYQIAVSEI